MKEAVSGSTSDNLQLFLVLFCVKGHVWDGGTEYEELAHAGL
jgi:hypothetical protein